MMKDPSMLCFAVADPGFSQGVPNLGEALDMILLNVPKNCMKSRNIWSLVGGGGRRRTGDAPILCKISVLI